MVYTAACFLFSFIFSSTSIDEIAYRHLLFSSFICFYDLFCHVSYLPRSANRLFVFYLAHIARLRSDYSVYSCTLWCGYILVPVAGLREQYSHWEQRIHTAAFSFCQNVSVEIDLCTSFPFILATLGPRSSCPVLVTLNAFFPFSIPKITPPRNNILKRKGRKDRLCVLAAKFFFLLPILFSATPLSAPPPHGVFHFENGMSKQFCFHQSRVSPPPPPHKKTSWPVYYQGEICGSSLLPGIPFAAIAPYLASKLSGAMCPASFTGAGHK